ncbi:MAG: hypothetical protein KDA24_28885 [Deltaproteobacteria bacterium]|nr:hypothetical protein [Deltaproteobacteria bacterium]
MSALRSPFPALRSLLWLAWMLSACAATSAPTCDDAEIITALAAADAAPADNQVRIVMGWLDLACTGTELRGERASVEIREAIAREDVRKDSSAWNTACIGGTDVLDELSDLPDEKRAAHAVDRCGLERLGIDTEIARGWQGDLVLYITAVGLAQGLDASRQGMIMDILRRPVAVRPEPTTVPPEELNLAVAITPSGFRVTASEVDPVDLPCKQKGCTIEPRDIQSVRAAYDFEGLRRVAKKLKDRHPAEKNVIIVPHGDLEYVVVVESMNVLREDPSGPADADGECEGRCLFPYVVLAGGAP